MNDDYGYFGKGIEGYVHYDQATRKKGGGGGGGGGGGCFWKVLAFALVIYMIVQMVECAGTL